MGEEEENKRQQHGIWIFESTGHILINFTIGRRYTYMTAHTFFMQTSMCPCINIM
jgi:hypothetical protein